MPYVENMEAPNGKQTFLLGYARVSTAEQNPEMQINALRKFGVGKDEIFTDVISGVKMNRPGMKKMLDVARKGDVIVVWKLDRLGRSLRGVLDTVEHIKKNGIGLKSLTEGIDTETPMGNAMFQMLLVIAELERNLIAERTKEGLKTYRENGGRMGQKHRIRDFPKRLARFGALYESGELFQMKGREVIDEMNRVDPEAPLIKVPQVYFNWKANGFPGFEPDTDLPLSD